MAVIPFDWRTEQMEKLRHALSELDERYRTLPAGSQRDAIAQTIANLRNILSSEQGIVGPLR